VSSRSFQLTSMNGCLLGFLFWVAFLLALEPGNLSRAAALGRELTLGREAVRILGASLIGAAAMPGVLALERRYTTTAGVRPRGVFWMLLGLVALAGAMNVVSCFLAAWGFERQWLPHPDSIRRQLIGNWMLLAFALAALTALIRLVRPASPAPQVAPLRHVIVKSGTRILRVDLHTVDWIEAQGNYVALHVGERSHLLRSTLAAFLTGLDARRFLRIHRGAVVAMDRVVNLRNEADGEISLQLATGQVMRVSKSHRKAVRARWKAGESDAQH
jgi:two-component system LytT family response regulator